jgi:anti-sigma factor RsiW
MTGLGDKAEGAALWQRWRSRWRAVAKDGGDDNALLLAAYVDGRLAAAKAEAVEEWLVDHPEALDDVIAARTAVGAALPMAPQSVLVRAEALVAARDETVVGFADRAARRRGWRTAAAWSGLAASLLATSLFGFALGSNAYFDLMRQPLAPESMFHQLLDPPGQLFSMEDEETST